MAVFDFPNNPTQNTTVAGPNGQTYVWDGVKWMPGQGTLVTGVSSVFTRTGAVVAASGDYTAAMVTGAVDQTQIYSDPNWISTLAYSKITGVPAAYVLPAATITTLGGVKVGANITVQADGTISVAAPTSPYVLPAATATVLGGVKIGANVTVQADGTISVPAPYVLPVATASVLGGVKQGSGVSIGADGTLSVTAVGGVSSVFTRTGAVVAQAGDYAAFYASLSGSYANPAWITSLDYSKLTNVPATSGFWQPGSGGAIYYNGGSVGIGTASPQCALDSAGMIRSTGLGTAPSTGTGVEIFITGGTSYVQSITRSPNSYIPLQLVGSPIGLSGGNVGLGITSPTFGVDIGVQTMRIRHMSSPNTGAGFWLDSPTTAQAVFVGMDASYTMMWRVYGNTGNQLLVDCNASMVGIGIAPAHKLDVNGDLQFQTSLFGNGKNIFSTADSYLRFNQSNSFSAGVWMGSSNLMLNTSFLAVGSQGGAGEIMLQGSAGDAVTRISMNGNSGGLSYFNTGGGVAIGGTSNPSDALVISGLGSGSGYGQLRMIQGNYGAFFRNDGSTFYLMFTNSGDQYGVWSSPYPLSFSLGGNHDATFGGSVTIPGNCIVSNLLQVGPSMASGTQGDINVSRTASPGTGAVFFGNGGRYIFFDGSNWNFNPPLPSSGGGVSTGGNVTGSRAINTTYTNSTGKALFISVCCNINASSSMYIYVNGAYQTIISAPAGGTVTLALFGIVLPGQQYLCGVGGGYLNYWNEWY